MELNVENASLLDVLLVNCGSGDSRNLDAGKEREDK